MADQGLQRVVKTESANNQTVEELCWMFDDDAFALVVVVQIRKLAKDISSFWVILWAQTSPSIAILWFYIIRKTDSYELVHWETYSPQKQNGTWALHVFRVPSHLRLCLDTGFVEGFPKDKEYVIETNKIYSIAIFKSVFKKILRKEHIFLENIENTSSHFSYILIANEACY